MILCETTILSPMAPGRAFDYMADFENASDWHPSIQAARRVSGDPALRSTRYEMTTLFGPLWLASQVEVLEVDRPNRFSYVVRTRLSTSRHEVSFAPWAEGVEVRTESSFRIRPALAWLAGPARPLLRRFCDRSAVSLRSALGARLQPGPTWIPGGPALQPGLPAALPVPGSRR